MATNRPCGRMHEQLMGDGVLELETGDGALLDVEHFATSEFQRNLIFGFFLARSCMIFEARSSSRRWINVTLLQSPARYSASSSAVSPPPTTDTSWSLKKKPSQVAHALTPRLVSSRSLGRPSQRALAPVEMITECVS